MKSTIARTEAEMEGSSGSLSSLEGEEGGAGEDRDGDSPGEDHDGDSPGEDCDGDSPKYSSSEEARDERGEGESPQANHSRWPVRSLEVNRLREVSRGRERSWEANR